MDETPPADKDVGKAKSWFRKAAEQGHKAAAKVLREIGNPGTGKKATARKYRHQG